MPWLNLPELGLPLLRPVWTLWEVERRMVRIRAEIVSGGDDDWGADWPPDCCIAACVEAQLSTASVNPVPLAPALLALGNEDTKSSTANTRKQYPEGSDDDDAS